MKPGVTNHAAMLAAVLHGIETVRVERRPIPNAGPGEVRVRIAAALTCGTDVKVYRRGYHARMIQPPAVFGHEFAGTIDSVGDGVSAWQPGDRVVAANSAPCGECFYCARNAFELCEDLLFLNGAYAQYIVVPARIVCSNMVRIEEGVPFAEAALAEPLACVVHALTEMKLHPGDTVAVLGAGPIGLLFCRMAKLAGSRVLVAGRHAHRLQVALQLGADVVLDVDTAGEIVSAICAHTEGGRGADVVVEAVGRPETWEQAIAAARKGGSVNLFGGCPAGTTIQVDTHRIHYDALTLRGAFHHTPATFRAAEELIASGQIMAGAFLGPDAPLADIPRIFAGLAKGRGGGVKYVIRPND
jgi:L-iditol 2-dehydrogenase